MTARKVSEICGGMSVLRKTANDLSRKYGIIVAAEPFVNEENPSDNWMNLVFEYPLDKDSEFIAARDEFAEFLSGKGLSFRYECSGDGETGIIASYRVR